MKVVVWLAIVVLLILLLSSPPIVNCQNIDRVLVFVLGVGGGQ